MLPQSLSDEFDFALALPAEILALRVLGAAILCGLIGLERAVRKNTAGVRTNMLIGVASVVFCIVTLELMHAYDQTDSVAQMDPIRLVEAVTAGIAFLAAGVVVYTKGDVQGLTTGASMWLSAAIGLSVGLGIWLLAIVATMTGIVVLWLLRKVEVAAGIKEDSSSKQENGAAG
ncbi:MgtC/SapB family protein [Rhizobium sp. Leaf262]|uniref:MgtC/SapB family protein n=1 Tax=Rhizobium sp. Leaf262 TaxID=1736312 RepID=UPI000712A5B6|nr:MgtC/SapB family protein [Rhizobium sp. Leaf262]KQO75400.1 preprotein translocase subunit TatA [Rhizobium sp. Leaf262]